MRQAARPAFRLLIVCLICVTALGGTVFGTAGCAQRQPAQQQPSGSDAGPSTPEPQPPPAPQSPSVPDAFGPWLRGGDAFPNGVTGCWVLANGNVLVESTGESGQQYSCMVVADDSVEPLTPDSWNCAVKEIRADSIDFIRRNSPSGTSPDIVTFSAETLKQTGTQPATDLTVKVAKQPAAHPELEPEAPYEGHDPISRALGKVAECWLLPDGTVLLTSRDQIWMFRWFPKHNDMCFVAGESQMATLIDIRDPSLDLLCCGEGPTAMRAFPYLLTYDLKTNELSQPKPVYLPVTTGVEAGWPHGNWEIILSDIRTDPDSLQMVAQDTMFQCPAEYMISNDPEKHELVLRMPGAQAKDLQLPLEFTNESGLIQAVRAESGVVVDGESEPGTTVHVSLDPEKWDRLTYNCSVSSQFTLNVYDDRQPTDISVRVAGGQ